MRNENRRVKVSKTGQGQNKGTGAEQNKGTQLIIGLGLVML